MHLEKIVPFRFLALAAALFFCVSPLPAEDFADEEYGERFDSIPIPDGLAKEDLRGVVSPALAARGWIVKEQSDRRVIGYLKHRGNEATATFLFDGEEITIFCVGWALNRRGERAKPEMPRGWLGNLKKDITKGLNVKAAQSNYGG